MDNDSKTPEQETNSAPENTIAAPGHLPRAVTKAREESKELQVSPTKADQFIIEFIKNGGNATEAAWVVFNCKNRSTAGVIGHQYLKQNKALIRSFMDSNGASFGDLVKNAIEKNKESKTPEWSDRLFKMADYEDFMGKGREVPQVVNIVQAQKEILKQYTEGEVIED